MADEVILPSLGQTTNELTIVSWEKQEGDLINRGDVLLQVETDKAIVEVEAYTDGVLKGIQYKEGDLVLVGSVLAWLVKEHELAAWQQPGGQTAAAAPAAEDSGAQAGEASAAAASSAVPASAAQTNGRILITPLARAIASQAGADVSLISGSGIGGVIKKRDVDSYLAQASDASAASADFASDAVESNQADSGYTVDTASDLVGITAPAAPIQAKRYKLSKMRKTIADRLSLSKQTIPHYYVTLHIDVTELAKLREQLKQLRGADVSYNSLIVRAAAYALRKHPEVNASLDGSEVVQHGHVSIGLAVEVPDGLRVPVVHHADQLDLWALTAALKQAAGKARDNQLSAREASGGTFTVTSLGMFGVDEFAAIINPPEAAILAVGRIADKPVVRDGALAVGKMLTLTLSVDHRLVDGALAGRFMQTIREELEQPLKLLTPIFIDGLTTADGKRNQA